MWQERAVKFPCMHRWEGLEGMQVCVHVWGRQPSIYIHTLCVYYLRTVYMSSILSSTHLCEKPSGCLCVQAICISVL